MSRYVLALAVAVVVAAAPFAVACDALKKDSADAAVVVAPAATTAAAAEPAPAVPVVAPVAPLGGPVAPTPGVVKPVAGDAGKPADAGAAADAGKTAPTPTPVFTIPTAIPGFDAAAFKPPPGFPSTLPTFPPPPPAPTR